MLFLTHIDCNIPSFRRLANDHSLVDLHACTDEQRTPLLSVIQPVNHCFTGFKGDQGTGHAAGNVAFIRLISVEHRGHDSLAAGSRHKIAAVAKQTAGRNGKLHPHPVALGRHMDQSNLAAAHLFHYRADRFLRHIHHQMLHRFVQLAADLLKQHSGSADLELIPLPAHGLDQDGQMHFAAARNLKRLGGIGIFYP